MWLDDVAELVETREELLPCERRRQQHPHLREVGRPEPLELEEPLEKASSRRPGTLDVPAHQRLGRASEGEGREGLVDVPRQHLQLAVGGVDQQVVVVRSGDEAVEARQQRRRREIPGDVLEIDPLADPPRELLIRAGLDESQELGEAQKQLPVLLAFLDVVSLVVPPGVVAEVLEVSHALGLHQEAVLRRASQARLDEVVVDLLDQHVQTQRFVLELAFDRQVDPYPADSRRRQSRLAIHLVADLLLEVGGVLEGVREVQLGAAAKTQRLGEAVRVHLEGLAGTVAGEAERRVALEPQADAVEALAVDDHRGLDVGVLRPRSHHASGRPRAAASGAATALPGLGVAGSPLPGITVAGSPLPGITVAGTTAPGTAIPSWLRVHRLPLLCADDEVELGHLLAGVDLGPVGVVRDLLRLFLRLRSLRWRLLDGGSRRAEDEASQGDGDSGGTQGAQSPDSASMGSDVEDDERPSSNHARSGKFRRFRSCRPAAARGARCAGLDEPRRTGSLSLSFCCLQRRVSPPASPEHGSSCGRCSWGRRSAADGWSGRGPTHSRLPSLSVGGLFGFVGAAGLVEATPTRLVAMPLHARRRGNAVEQVGGRVRAAADKRSRRRRPGGGIPPVQEIDRVVDLYKAVVVRVGGVHTFRSIKAPEQRQQQGDGIGNVVESVTIDVAS